jgi:hypothetical protein
VTDQVQNVTDQVQNVTDQVQNVTDRFKLCLCGCGRNVTSQRAKYYDYSCRKRAQRKREKLYK